MEGATTKAMQSGLEGSETEKAGEEAANKIIDEGPKNFEEYQKARTIVDDNEVEKTLWLVRKLSGVSESFMSHILSDDCRIFGLFKINSP